MENAKAHVVQILLQSAYAGLALISRAALLHGLNRFVFVAYRHVVALFAIAPFALFFERKGRPPLTWSVCLQIFLVSLGLTVSHNLYFQGLYRTSSTVAAAAVNVIPVSTLMIAILLRQEEVNIRNLRGLGKIHGTFVCVGGALVMCLYRGPPIYVVSFNLDARTNKRTSSISGFLMLFGGTLLWSACLVLQGTALKKYPLQLSLTSLICLTTGVLSSIATFIFEKEKLIVWEVGLNIELVGVLYAGVVATGIGLLIQGWTLKRKGPLFLAAYSPVALVITAMLEALIFHVVPTWGSLLGALLMVTGLYLVLWGKAADTFINSTQVTSKTSELVRTKLSPEQNI